MKHVFAGILICLSLLALLGFAGCKDQPTAVAPPPLTSPKADKSANSSTTANAPGAPAASNASSQDSGIPAGVKLGAHASIITPARTNVPQMGAGSSSRMAPHAGTNSKVVYERGVPHGNTGDNSAPTSSDNSAPASSDNSTPAPSGN